MFSGGPIGSETEELWSKGSQELWSKGSEESIADMEGLPSSPPEKKQKNVNFPTAVNVPPFHRAGQPVKAVKTRQVKACFCVKIKFVFLFCLLEIEMETLQPPMDEVKDRLRRRVKKFLFFFSFQLKLRNGNFSNFFFFSFQKEKISNGSWAFWCLRIEN